MLGIAVVLTSTVEPCVVAIVVVGKGSGLQLTELGVSQMWSSGLKSLSGMQ